MKAIVCTDMNGCIGVNGKLLIERFSEDMNFFKKTTINHPIIMGTKTYLDVGRPLCKRKNIILSHNPEKFTKDINDKNVEFYSSIEDILNAYPIHNDIYVIGGGTIYEQFLPHIDTVYMTKVYIKTYGGDTFFPKLNESEWMEDPTWDSPLHKIHEDNIKINFSDCYMNSNKYSEAYMTNDKNYIFRFAKYIRKGD